MNDKDCARLKKLLEARQEELGVLSSGSADARKPVELDQQSVGRLSRQDALQQQAMANAQETRRIVEARKVEAALARIEEGEYGYCADCGEAVALKRLEINLTTELCIQCAGGGAQQ